MINIFFNLEKNNKDIFYGKKTLYELKSGSGLDNFFSISGHYYAMRGNKTGHISFLNDTETQERGFRELKTSTTTIFPVEHAS